MLAKILRFLVIRLVRIFFRIQIAGTENIPHQGGGLVVCNHISLLDPFMITAAFPRPVRFVMSRKIYEFWLWKGLMKQLRMVPIDGGECKERLEVFNRTCQNMINEGELICIFPEGQITRIGHLLAFRKGIEHISKGISGGILPVQMEAGLGMPLSFKSGTQDSYGFRVTIPRKRILFSVGSVLPANTSSYFVRQKVQELQASNFNERFRPFHSIPYFMKKAVSQYRERAFVAGDGKLSFGDLGRPNILKQSDDKPTKGYSLNWYKQQLEALGKSPPGKLLQDEEGLQMVKYSPNQEVGIDAVAYQYNSPENTYEITHRNVLAVVKALRLVYHLRDKEVTMGVFSSGSPYGKLFNLWLPLFMGHRVVPPLSMMPDQLAEQLSTSQVTVLMAPAEIVKDICRSSSPTHWSSVTDVIIGIEKLDEATAEAMKQYNIRVIQSTGTDDGRTIFAVNSPDFIGKDVTGRKMSQEGAREGSVGRPLPGIATRLLDTDGNEVLYPGTIGKLYIKGAAVVKSVSNDKSDWTYTGYSAKIDEDGFIYISE